MLILNFIYTVTGKSLVTNFQIAITFDIDDASFRSIHHFNHCPIIFLYLVQIFLYVEKKIFYDRLKQRRYIGEITSIHDCVKYSSSQHRQTKYYCSSESGNTMLRFFNRILLPIIFCTSAELPKIQKKIQIYFILNISVVFMLMLQKLFKNAFCSQH